jgi:hypothetical protein
MFARPASIAVVVGLAACHGTEPPSSPDAAPAPSAAVIANKTASRLVVDGDTLFFWSTDGLWRVELEGSGLRRLVDSAQVVDAPFTVGDGLADLDIVGDDIALLDSGHHARDFSDGAIRTVPRQGGALTSLRDNVYFPVTAAIHDGRIYWGEIDGGGVRSVRADGGDYQTHVWCADCFHQSVAVSTAGLWYTLSGNTTGSVRLVDANGTETTIAVAQRNPRSLVVDGNDAFWISQFTLGGEPGSVMHAGVGLVPEIVADGIARPGSLSLDPTYVYFVEETAGALYRVGRDSKTRETLVEAGVVSAAPYGAGVVIATDSEIRIVPRS